MLEEYFAGVQERVKAHNWRMEAIVGGLTLVTVVLYVVGQTWNRRKLNAWIDSQADNLKDQFFQVGVTRNQLYVRDDDQHYLSYATGRINIARFVIKLTLQARQNFSMWIMENAMSFFLGGVDVVSDEVDILADSSEKVDPFIFAIVNKEYMGKERKDNYYLSLTKTTDSEKLLPVQYVFMSESNEINETLVDEEFKQLLAESHDIVKLLAFTDQPSAHPFDLENTNSKFRGILKLHLKSDLASLVKTSKIINKFIETIDLVHNPKKFKLRAEVSKKIAKARESEVKKLEKLIDQDKKEQLEEKKLEELKKQKEKLKTSNPKELEKFEKKQREKQQRKLMKKQKVRG